MDPITHGIIGLAISTFSGTVPTLTNPIAIGATIGAIMPDSDVVIRFFKNDAVYLKAHRGKSHSIPVLAVMSLVVTFGLIGFSVLMKSMTGIELIDRQWLVSFTSFNSFCISAGTIFLWTLIGGISHTVFDSLNSYGAMLFQKKIKANLLTLYDPIITLICLFLIFKAHKTVMDYGIALLAVVLYLGIRYAFRQHARRRIAEAHGITREILARRTVKLHVMPALKAFHKWDYVLKSQDQHIVGQYNSVTTRMKRIATFDLEGHAYWDQFKRSSLGRYLNEFSPTIHLKVIEEQGKITLRAIDLRYFHKNEFMHQGTLELSSEGKIEGAYVHPYKKECWIPIK